MSEKSGTHLEIRVVSGMLLSAQEREEISSFCSAAYEEEMEPILNTFVDATHVLGFFEGALTSHALWVTRYLQVGDQPPLRTAYVEAVATGHACRNRGFATVVLKRLAAEVQDFDLAALSPSDAAFYERLGWELWQGPLFIRTKDGLLPSPDDEEVMILRLPQTPSLDLSQPLSAEWREGELW